MKFRFLHNNLNVLDLEKSLAFYEAALGLTEYIDLDFRLGEAIGAGIQTRMLDYALSVYRECVTKEEAGVKA